MMTAIMLSHLNDAGSLVRTTSKVIEKILYFYIHGV